MNATEIINGHAVQHDTFPGGTRQYIFEGHDAGIWWKHTYNVATDGSAEAMAWDYLGRAGHRP